MKAKQAGILSILLASICCGGPLLLIAVGLGTGAAVISRYRWLFIAAAIVVLVLAWTKYFCGKRTFDRKGNTIQGRRRGAVTLLTATAIVLGFIGINTGRYLFATTPASAQAQSSLASGMNRIVIRVEGMTCATCEVGVRYALKSVTGVESARVSAAAKTATVDYDPAKTNPEQLVAAINSTGYRATLPRNQVHTTGNSARQQLNQEKRISMD